MKHRILITGGAGFIGSHLARELASAGHKVRVLDCLLPQVHGENGALPSFIQDKVEFLRGNVRSRQDLKHALQGIDVVYHFAASVGVGQSMYEVHGYVENNNVGTANLLQLLIEQPVRKLIVASSMSIYGEGLYMSHGEMKERSDIRRELALLKLRQWDPVDTDGGVLRPLPTPESKTPDLASIYALSKYDQERMCLLIGRAYKIPTVALRFFNVYGRGQALSNPYTGVMAIFASRLLNDRPPLIFEDGKQLRDFVHVSDVVQACQLALENPDADGEVFNIGSGMQYTVNEVATRVAEAVGKERIHPQVTGEYRVGDIRHCFADISRSRDTLGYRPQVSLAGGLSDLAEWLLEQNALDRSQEMREALVTRGLAI